MGDPTDKQAKLPVRPERTRKTIQPPVRPAHLPLQNSAKMPVRPAIAQPPTIRMPDRPASRKTAATGPVEAVPVRPSAAVARPYASTPKARGGTSYGSFGALASIVVPTDRERDAARRAKCELQYDSAVAFRVTGLIHAPHSEPSEYDAMVPEAKRAVPARTMRETQGLRDRGFKFSRETATLGDLSGRRAAASYSQAAGLESREIQPDVPVHWFMSPDIPGWKSRAVPTERIGQAASHAASDLAEEAFRAIFDAPTAETVAKSYYRRWPAYYRERHGSEATAASLGSQLWDELVEEEFQRADRRLEYAYAIGSARFARLWNLAIAACTNQARAVAQGAIDVPVVPASDVSLTS